MTSSFSWSSDCSIRLRSWPTAIVCCRFGKLYCRVKRPSIDADPASLRRILRPSWTTDGPPSPVPSSDSERPESTAPRSFRMIVSNDCVSNPPTQWRASWCSCTCRANLRAAHPLPQLIDCGNQRSQFRHTSSMWVPDVAAAGPPAADLQHLSRRSPMILSQSISHVSRRHILCESSVY